MISIFYDSENNEVARMDGRHSVADLPVSGAYTVKHIVTSDDVREEAARRMIMLVGARDAAHLERTIQNGSREAIRLLGKDRQSWSTKEEMRAQQLNAMDAAIEAIRAASNKLEPAPPPNFADDQYWPRF